MLVALQKFRAPTLIFALFLLLAWSILLRTKQSYYEIESMYTVEDFSQDTSKIYFDMGVFAQKRGDWQSAIRFYQAALDHNHSFHEAEHFLKFCLNQSQRTLV